MATIQIIENPFQPHHDCSIYQGENGISIRQWVDRHLGKENAEFAEPTICFVNGEVFMREAWEWYTLHEKDVVTFISKVGEVTFWTIVIASVVGVGVGFLMTPEIPNLGLRKESPPLYSLTGAKNKAKMGEPIECPYGKNKIYPTYASTPFNKFIDNDQWQYQLLCLGHGKYTIHGVYIEDTPIENFDEVTYQIIQPGDPWPDDLWPNNVVTSSEVSNLLLPRINTPTWEGGATVESGPWYGPFVACGVGERATRLEVDFVWPRGVCYVGNDGQVWEQASWFDIQYMEIDDLGNEIGTWTSFFGPGENNMTRSQLDPIRHTYKVDVPSGRYSVRARHLSNSDGNERQYVLELRWSQLRAFLPNTKDYGEVTLLAISAKATNSFNDQSSNKVNVLATRHLPVWNGTSWVEQETRSKVWAFCDVFRSTYGGALTDNVLDLDRLSVLNGEYEARGEHFDYVFEEQMSLWNAASIIAGSGRASPTLNGSIISIIRDEARTVPTAFFGPHNMVKGSFSYSLKMAEEYEYDGLECEYIDPDSYLPEVVTAVLSDESGNNLDTVFERGVIDRDQVYRLGLYKRAVRRYRSGVIAFQTGMEGHIPSYGDLIAVQFDVPRWGQGGYVKSIVGTTVVLSESVEFDTGTHVIAFSTKYGEMLGPYTCTAGASANEVILAAAPDTTEFFFDDKHDPPRFGFGKQDMAYQMALVTRTSPSQDETVDIEAAVYSNEPYLYDSSIAPPKNSPPIPPNIPDRPEAKNLTVNILPTTISFIQAVWDLALGATSYVVQQSFDGANWSDVGTTTANFLMIPTNANLMYIRVAGIGKAGRGPWSNVWSGETLPALQKIPSFSITSRASAQGGLQVTATWDDSGNEYLVNEGIVYIQALLSTDPTISLEFNGKFYKDGSGGELVIDFPIKWGSKAFTFSAWHQVEFAGQATRGPQTRWEDGSEVLIPVTVHPDTLPPSIPSGTVLSLSYASDLAEMTLTWNDEPLDDDVSHADVYLTIGAGTKEKIGRVELGVQKFIDKYVAGVGGPQTYAYEVKWVDLSGNESSPVSNSQSVPPLPAGGIPSIPGPTGFAVAATAATVKGGRFTLSWTQDGSSSSDVIKITYLKATEPENVMIFEDTLGTDGTTKSVTLPIMSTDGADGSIWRFRAQRGELNEGIVFYSEKTSSISRNLIKYDAPPDDPEIVGISHTALVGKTTIQFRQREVYDLKGTDVEFSENGSIWRTVKTVPELKYRQQDGDEVINVVHEDIYASGSDRTVYYRLRNFDNAASPNYSNYVSGTVNVIALNQSIIVNKTAGQRYVEFTWTDDGSGGEFAIQVLQDSDWKNQQLAYPEISDEKVGFYSLPWTGTTVWRIWQGYVINGKSVWAKVTQGTVTVDEYPQPASISNFNAFASYGGIWLQWTPATIPFGGLDRVEIQFLRTHLDQSATVSEVWEVFQSIDPTLGNILFVDSEKEDDGRYGYNFRIRAVGPTGVAGGWTTITASDRHHGYRMVTCPPVKGLTARDTYTVASVSTSADALVISFTNDIEAWSPVKVTSTGSMPGGVIEDKIYFASLYDGNLVRLYISPFSLPVNITSSGSGTITLHDYTPELEIYSRDVTSTADVNGINDTLFFSGGGTKFKTGDWVQLFSHDSGTQTQGTPPPSVTIGKPYFCERVSNDEIRLFSNEEDYLSGANPIDFSSTGSWTQLRVLRSRIPIDWVKTSDRFGHLILTTSGGLNPFSEGVQGGEEMGNYSDLEGQYTNHVRVTPDHGSLGGFAVSVSSFSGHVYNSSGLKASQPLGHKFVTT